jgi:acyl-CoA synthetase (AMP-forming)/AMP-acid ligase II
MSTGSFRADLAAIAAEQADAVAIIGAREERSYGYAELVALLDRFAPLFLRYGICAERPLLALAPNAVEPFVTFLATLWHGTGYAPLAADASPRELRRWIETVTPAAALVGATIAPALREVLDELAIPVIEATSDGEFGWVPLSDGPRFPAADEPGRVYLQTSGTTGEPRALVIDGDRLWASGRAFVAVHDFVQPTCRFLNNLPLSYLGGLFNLGLIPLAARGSTVITEAFSGKSIFDFWQTVERYNITLLWLVPTIVRGLLSIARRTHRTGIVSAAARPVAAFIGTAPIDLETKREFETIFSIPLLENFALSETTFFTSDLAGALDGRSQRSVGRILPYVDVRFIPLDPTAAGDVPTEIAVKSPFLALGYRTTDGFRPLACDTDGYFATGDIGHLDAASGHVVIDGRRREIIKKGGLFVALREIEVVATQHADVIEAAAVAVPHDFYGESSVLYVRLNDGAQLDAFTSWLRANLVRYKWPEATYAVDDFPRTSTGKIRKHRLVAPTETNVS